MRHATIANGTHVRKARGIKKHKPRALHVKPNLAKHGLKNGK